MWAGFLNGNMPSFSCYMLLIIHFIFNDEYFKCIKKNKIKIFRFPDINNLHICATNALKKVIERNKTFKM